MKNLQPYRVKIISPHSEKESREIVESFRFQGDIQWTELKAKEMPEGKVPILICKCGHRDFAENGRMINEYECNGCSVFVELDLKNG